MPKAAAGAWDGELSAVELSRRIVAMRLEGRSYRDICYQLRCTENQVQYWWQLHKARRVSPLPTLEVARAALREEIEAARAERAMARPFRLSPEDWAHATGKR